MAVSRFVSRKGCYMYGKLRRSDFLPVGAEKEDEILERVYDNESSGSDCDRGLQFVAAWSCDPFGEDNDAERLSIDCIDFADMDVDQVTSEASEDERARGMEHLGSGQLDALAEEGMGSEPLGVSPTIGDRFADDFM